MTVLVTVILNKARHQLVASIQQVIFNFKVWQFVLSAVVASVFHIIV